MMWDHVMESVKALITADPTLNAIFGDNFRKSGPAVDLAVPIIEWTLLADTETELWAPMLIQFDCWTKTAADSRVAERRLRSLFMRTTSIVFDTYAMITEYADGADLAVPNRSGYVGRGVRFRMSPLRQQYARPV